MPQPLFTPKKDLVPLVQDVEWAPRPVWTGSENLAPTGIRSPDRPARSQSLFDCATWPTKQGLGVQLNTHGLHIFTSEWGLVLLTNICRSTTCVWMLCESSTTTWGIDFNKPEPVLVSLLAVPCLTAAVTCVWPSSRTTYTNAPIHLTHAAISCHCKPNNKTKYLFRASKCGVLKHLNSAHLNKCTQPSKQPIFVVRAPIKLTNTPSESVNVIMIVNRGSKTLERGKGNITLIPILLQECLQISIVCFTIRFIMSDKHHRWHYDDKPYMVSDSYKRWERHMGAERETLTLYTLAGIPSFVGDCTFIPMLLEVCFITIMTVLV